LGKKIELTNAMLNTLLDPNGHMYITARPGTPVAFNEVTAPSTTLLLAASANVKLGTQESDLTNIQPAHPARCHYPPFMGHRALKMQAINQSHKLASTTQLGQATRLCTL
jgi:hypothetical protein